MIPSLDLDRDLRRMARCRRIRMWTQRALDLAALGTVLLAGYIVAAWLTGP